MNTETFTLLSPQECSLAHAIELVGDKWTLMILREALYGVRRFNQIHQDIGIPRTILSNRLRKLVKHDILNKEQYREQGKRARFEYVLTPHGKELIIAFTALMEWGEQIQNKNRQQRLHLHDSKSGERIHVRLVTESGNVINSMSQIRVRVAKTHPSHRM